MAIFHYATIDNDKIIARERDQLTEHPQKWKFLDSLQQEGIYSRWYRCRSGLNAGIGWMLGVVLLGIDMDPLGWIRSAVALYIVP